MKRKRSISTIVLLLVLLSMMALAACSSGSLGNEGIAFMRDGKLWTIDPDGSNAFAAVAEDTAVLGYGLSPDHEIFTFRTIDGSFAQSSAGKHLAIDPVTGMVGDMPSTLNAIGIDGGTPIPIILSSTQITHSAAWWTPDGSHLLYRESVGTNLASPDLTQWWVSQDDQPDGIARRSLPPSLSIPSINTQSSSVISDSVQGIFTTTMAGANLVYIQPDRLSGHPLPASLERLLWQPNTQQPALLYAIVLPTHTTGQGQFALVLRTANGQTRTLTTCACRQFAWSPDGQDILYSTDQGYTILNIQNGNNFNFTAEHGAVPYWSPDSKTLLLDGLHTLSLVRIATKQVQILLSDSHAPIMTDGPLASNAAFLQPLGNSLWNVNNHQFVLVTRGRTLWQGQPLNSGNGLYIVTLNNQDEPQGTPALLDANGHDTQPGWSYINPDTSFLF